MVDRRTVTPLEEGERVRWRFGDETGTIIHRSTTGRYVVRWHGPPPPKYRRSTHPSWLDREDPTMNRDLHCASPTCSRTLRVSSFLDGIRLRLHAERFGWKQKVTPGDRPRLYCPRCAKDA